MKTQGFVRLMLGAAAGMLVLLAISAGIATAQLTPSTAAYQFSSHPMISGTVVSVNDHQMVVDTDQGQRVTLDMDSRTLSPRDFGPGMVMRAEFKASDDCRLYAERIIPIRKGMSTHRLQAYANTREGGTVMAAGAASYKGQHGERLVGTDAPGWYMKATPNTTNYQYSNRPMITGQVISVTDHRLVVSTDQGQTVGLAMDSHTMIPREVGPGSIVRAQLLTFRDGRHYAQRVSRIGEGVVGREQAYAHTRDDDFRFAATPPDCEEMLSPNTQTSVVVPAPEVVKPSPPIAQIAPQPVAEPPVAIAAEPIPVIDREEALPQTASNQSSILLLGLGALGLAGLIAAARALRNA